MLQITLDENDCFTAWVSSKDCGIGITQQPSQPTNGQQAAANDAKINLGGLLLQALLSEWPRANGMSEMSAEEQGLVDPRHKNGYFSIPGHTPIILCEPNGRTLFRLQAKDASGETESMLLSENLPQWVTEIVVDRAMPKYNKIPFYLLPHPSSNIRITKKDRLSASDMLQVRKVMEHVFEKILYPPPMTDGAGNTNSYGQDDKSQQQISTPPVPANIEEKMEMFCQDHLLDPNMDLRTVRHFIWKQGGDLILYFKPIK